MTFDQQLRDRKDEAGKRLEEIEAQLAEINSDKDAPSLELPPELQEFSGPEGDEVAYMKWEVRLAGLPPGPLTLHVSHWQAP